MRNTININEGAGIYTVAQTQGADSMIVNFQGISAATNQLEFYQGNEYSATLACRTLNNTASCTLPAEAFTGNNLHFRLIQNGTPGQFYHITYDPEQPFIFKPLNNVVYSNKNMLGKTSSSSTQGLNTYGDLEPFTQEHLALYNHKYLRGGTLR